MNLEFSISDAKSQREKNLSKRIDFGMDNYQKNSYFEDYIINMHDNINSKTSLDRLGYANETIEGFSKHYASLKDKNYSQRIRYINSIKTEGMDKDFCIRLNVLKQKYAEIIDNCNQLKFGLKKETFELIEQSLGYEIIDIKNENEYKKKRGIYDYFCLKYDPLNPKSNIEIYSKVNPESDAKIDSESLKNSLKIKYRQGSKSKILEEIITPILADAKRNYLPKEAMDLIESQYDFITFEGGHKKKIYINPNSFKKAWYDIKKKIKPANEIIDEASSATKNDFLKSLAFYLNDSKADNFQELDFNALEKSELEKLIPKHSCIKKENGIDLIEKLGFEINNDSIKQSYYQQKLEIFNDYAKKIIMEMPKEDLANFCKSNIEILKFDSESSRIDEIINDFSKFSMKILGIGNSYLEDVKGIFAEKISASANSGEEFNLIKLKYELQKRI